MTTLYVKEQGSLVRRTGERLVVTKEKEVLEDVPIIHIDQVVVMGNVQLTTPAVALLLQKDVDVVFLSSRGKFRGRLVTTGSRFAVLRHAQLRLLNDEAIVLATAKTIVDGKLLNQAALLRRKSGNAVSRGIAGIEQARRQAQHAGDIDTLRGYEGAAGAAYFGALKALISPEWGFTKRIYHPPPDPVNALLSLGYTLLLKDITAAVQLVGLDPYLGFFHVLDYGRPSLTLDLMEPFRPLVDEIVLRLIDQETIKPSDFKITRRDERPNVTLQDAALKHYLEAYEAMILERATHPGADGLTSRRRCMELQARDLAQVVLGKRERFRTFVMESVKRKT